MLTVLQVAERLSVSPACVYRLIDSGRLLAHRIGIGRGTIRVSEDQLAAFLDEAETRPAAARVVERAKGGLKHIRL